MQINSKQFYSLENDLIEASHSSSLYQQLVDAALELLDIDRGSILIHDGNSLNPQYFVQKETPVQVVVRKKGFSHKAFITGEQQVYDKEEVMEYHPELIKSGLKSFAVVPIKYGKEVKGVFHFSS